MGPGRPALPAGPGGPAEPGSPGGPMGPGGPLPPGAAKERDSQSQVKEEQFTATQFENSDICDKVEAGGVIKDKFA